MKNVSRGATVVSVASTLLMLSLVPAWGEFAGSKDEGAIPTPAAAEKVEDPQNSSNPLVTDYKNPKLTPGTTDHYHVTICKGTRIGPFRPWGDSAGKGKMQGESKNTPPPAPGAKPVGPHAEAGLDPNHPDDHPNDVQIQGHTPGDSDCTLSLKDGDKVIATVVISVHVIDCKAVEGQPPYGPDPKRTDGVYPHPRGRVSLDGGAGGSGQIYMIPSIPVAPPPTTTSTPTTDKPPTSTPPTDAPPTDKKTNKTATTSDTPGDTLTDTTEATGGQPGVFGGDATVTAPAKQYPLTDKAL